MGSFARVCVCACVCMQPHIDACKHSGEEDCPLYIDTYQ